MKPKTHVVVIQKEESRAEEFSHTLWLAHKATGRAVCSLSAKGVSQAGED